VKIQEQARDGHALLGRLIEPFTVAMCTRADARGTLVSEPMSALEMDAAGDLWFTTRKGLQPPDDVAALNAGFVDSTADVYISVSGHGRIVTDPARLESLWMPFARPWAADGSGSADLTLLCLTPACADRWDAAHHAMTRLFVAEPVQPAGDEGSSAATRT
jgi:general stress protein 26